MAWVDPLAGQAYDYPEISGYALTFLAGQADLEEVELAAGFRASEWLLGRLRRRNLAARDGWDNNAIYLFDLAMIASGLLSFGRVVQVERIVEAGLGLVRFIEDELQAAALSAVASGGPRSSRRGWSTDGQAHLAKLVQAFLLARETGSVSEQAARIIDRVQALQQPDGRLLTIPGSRTTVLHPHFYAAEGLWIWGSAHGDKRALEGAAAAVDWAWAQQLESGAFPRSVTGARPAGDAAERSDVTAQAVRLALLLGRPYRDRIERAVARLVEVTHVDEGARGIVYMPAAPRRHVNTWATMFAAQALALSVPGAIPIGWSHLV